MAIAGQITRAFQAVPFTTSLVIGSFSLLFFLFFIRIKFISKKKMESITLPPVPEVPGLPILGNLLQLKEKKPHKTFTKWAETYGPIYSIKTGASTVIVLNSNDVAKEVKLLVRFFGSAYLTNHSCDREAMVTRYSSISTRKLSNALMTLTSNKCMVATSDYDEFHKMIKRCIVASVLGSTAQKRHRCHRYTMMENISSQFRAHIDNHPLQAVNFRKIFEPELFALAMKQGVGKDVESIYVKELGKTLSKEEIFKILVVDLMEGAIEVDWRDFFPYLRWVPNKSLEMKLERIVSRRQAVMNALISDAKKRIASGEELNCYIDFLLSEANSLTEQQMSMLLWETIIESSDTTLVATEWAMYQLAKDRTCQDRLYKEIQTVCRSNKITEENIAQIPYLSAVFHETLRKHSPAPVVPVRYAHEDTEIGGYFIPAGSEIAINIYGCNMDKRQWENPEEWKPERFLGDKYDPMDLYKTMAFGAGKRVCAGSLQAVLIVCTAIGRLVQEFDWSLRDGEEEDVDTKGLTTRKLHPLHAIIRPRH